MGLKIRNPGYHGLSGFQLQKGSEPNPRIDQFIIFLLNLVILADGADRITHFQTQPYENQGPTGHDSNSTRRV